MVPLSLAHPLCEPEPRLQPSSGPTLWLGADAFFTKVNSDVAYGATLDGCGGTGPAEVSAIMPRRAHTFSAQQTV